MRLPLSPTLAGDQPRQEHAPESTAYPFRKTSPRWALAAAVCLPILLMACSDSAGPTCTAPAVGTVSASVGTTPTITWSADCPAVRLAVYPTATGTPTWELQANTSRIPKPVAYGTLPPGVTELQAAGTLTPGTEYGILVSILHGQDTLSAIGTFTP